MRLFENLKMKPLLNSMRKIINEKVNKKSISGVDSSPLYDCPHNNSFATWILRKNLARI